MAEIVERNSGQLNRVLTLVTPEKPGAQARKLPIGSAGAKS